MCRLKSMTINGHRLIILSEDVESYSHTLASYDSFCPHFSQGIVPSASDSRMKMRLHFGHWTRLSFVSKLSSLVLSITVIAGPSEIIGSGFLGWYMTREPIDL